LRLRSSSRRLAGSVGVVLTYDYLDYSFSGPGALVLTAPWSTVQRYGVSFARASGRTCLIVRVVRWSFASSSSPSWRRLPRCAMASTNLTQVDAEHIGSRAIEILIPECQPGASAGLDRNPDQWRA